MFVSVCAYIIMVVTFVPLTLLQNWAFSDIQSGVVISKGNDPASNAG